MVDYCVMCGGDLPKKATRRRMYCGRRCRERAYKLRKNRMSGAMLDFEPTRVESFYECEDDRRVRHGR